MAWYNASWTYRQKITIDATYVDEAISVVPVYLSKLNKHFFLNAKAAGADIRVTSGDGVTEVARYIASYDATTETGCMFVEVGATISTSVDTSFYVYYGNPAANDYATSSTYGRDDCFSSYAGFYLPGMTTADLTGAGRDLTAVASPGTTASGYEGVTAATYDGSTQYHKYDGAAALTDWPLTIETLAYATTTTGDMDPVSIRRSDTSTPLALIRVNSSNNVQGLFRGGSGLLSTASAPTTLSDATWAHIAVSRDADSGTSTSRLNGGTAGTKTTTLADLAASSIDRFAIGCSNASGTPLSFWDGNVAAAWLYDSAKSANFIATEYDSWSNASFISAGEIETETGGLTGWVLFQSTSQSAIGAANGDWANLANAIDPTSNVADATVDEVTVTATEIAYLTNPAYGITIPSGMTTYGAKFLLRCYSDTSSGRNVEDALVQMIDETSTLVGSNLKKSSATKWDQSTSLVNREYETDASGLDETRFTSASGFAVQGAESNTNGNTGAYIVAAWMLVEWDDAAAAGDFGGFFQLMGT